MTKHCVKHSFPTWICCFMQVLHCHVLFGMSSNVSVKQLAMMFSSPPNGVVPRRRQPLPMCTGVLISLEILACLYQGLKSNLCNASKLEMRIKGPIVFQEY